MGDVDVFDGQIVRDAEGVGVEVGLAPLEEEVGLDFGSEFGGVGGMGGEGEKMREE